MPIWKMDFSSRFFRLSMFPGVEKCHRSLCIVKDDWKDSRDKSSLFQALKWWWRAKNWSERRKQKRGRGGGGAGEGEALLPPPSPQPPLLHPQSPLVFFLRSPPLSESLEQAKCRATGLDASLLFLSASCKVLP